MHIADVLAEQLDWTRDWTLKLLADFERDDWSFQPQPGLAHALWLCGHLACAEDLLIAQRVIGAEGMLDAAFTAHFPIGAPVKSATEHDYPSADEILRVMHETHQRTLNQIRTLDDEQLRQPAYGKGGSAHPHYRDKLGAVAHCNRHEAFHAGQLATIRRLRGKPFLR